ncbi:MAG: hypothetical protein E6I91_20115 [Chloroflexi bacterium]|nr:MAG: hypothetical protein E6I91_20115 [Chloroflexota bacterium]
MRLGPGRGRRTTQGVPRFTWVGYLREGNGVPIGAGEVWMERGDACVALARGSRRSWEEDEGDASVPSPHHPNPRPYGDEGPSQAT